MEMGPVLLIILFVLMALFAASVYISFRKRKAASEENEYIE